jgi:5-methylcytosine-specific restriction protein A
MRYCAHPGCSELVSRGYCEKHERVQKAKRNLKKRDEFYGTNRWRKVRNRYWKLHPLCEDCLSRGITKQADMVDHIEEIKAGGAKLDPNNLRALCWGCHAKKTVRERMNRAR